MIDKMLEFVAPHLCYGCGKVGTLLCNHCKYDIINQSAGVCLLCQRATLSGMCEEHSRAYSGAWVVSVRTGVLQRLIGGFKFQNVRAAAKDLADLLDSCLPSLAKNTVLVPIPTTPAHIRERGYDHLGLIAQHLGVKRVLPIARVLERGNTATQHHADRATRLVQARSAFRLAMPINPDITYLILDDVVTTGATITEATRLLSDAGARFIQVAVLARQPLD